MGCDELQVAPKQSEACLRVTRDRVLKTPRSCFTRHFSAISSFTFICLLMQSFSMHRERMAEKAPRFCSSLKKASGNETCSSARPRPPFNVMHHLCKDRCERAALPEEHGLHEGLRFWRRRRGGGLGRPCSFGLFSDFIGRMAPS